MFKKDARLSVSLLTNFKTKHLQDALTALKWTSKGIKTSYVTQVLEMLEINIGKQHKAISDRIFYSVEQVSRPAQFCQELSNTEANQKRAVKELILWNYPF